jgi:ribosomal protein S18 acetylase RimI-like enzyme
MIHSFKQINFPKEFNIFQDFRRRAELEVMGVFDDNTTKLNRYVDQSLQFLGPNAFMHMYFDNNLIGQIELGVKNAKGYIHLFYLLPEFRHRGHFKIMHSKAIEILKLHNFDSIQLATAISNTRTIEIYEYYGWVNIGNNTNKPGLVNFEYTIAQHDEIQL